jgi:hypothetical protein
MWIVEKMTSFAAENDHDSFLCKRGGTLIQGNATPTADIYQNAW